MLISFHQIHYTGVKVSLLPKSISPDNVNGITDMDPATCTEFKGGQGTGGPWYTSLQISQLESYNHNKVWLSGYNISCEKSQGPALYLFPVNVLGGHSSGKHNLCSLMSSYVAAPDMNVCAFECPCNEACSTLQLVQRPKHNL